MKFRVDDELIVIYLYNIKLELSNKNELTKIIKNFLNKLTNYYKIELSGMYKVTIYENRYYGYVLEFLKIKDFEYGDFIDLKIDIKFNQTFYLVVDNYSFIEHINNFFYKNGLYYVNIANVNNVNVLFEYGDVLYKNINYVLRKCVNIVK